MDMTQGPLKHNPHAVASLCARPTGDDVDDAVGDPQGLVELFCRPDHLIKHLPGFAVVWGGVDKLLNLRRKQRKLSIMLNNMFSIK